MSLIVLFLMYARFLGMRMADRTRAYLQEHATILEGTLTGIPAKWAGACALRYIRFDWV